MAQTVKNKPIIFALIGAINTALDFGILLVLRLISVPIMVANIISTSVAFSFSFSMNRKFTFRATSGKLKKQLVLFVIVTLFGLWVLQNAVIWLIVSLLMSFDSNLALIIAKLCATVISLLWNYILYDTIVFKGN